MKLELMEDWPIYRPDTDTLVPGVLILHGSEGPWAGWSHRFAAILAAHGYAALPYRYGEGTVWGAGGIHQVDLAGVLDTGAAFKAHPAVDQVALFGWSRGGEATMHIAAHAGDASPFTAYAAHAPADRVVQAFDAKVIHGLDRTLPEDARAWIWDGHDEHLVPKMPIEIERCTRPVFLSVGTADEVWDPAMTQNLAQRLTDEGRTVDLFVAEGQGHGFSFDREPELWHRLTQFFEVHLKEA